MDKDFLLNQAIKRYDNEVERMKAFDTKASNQIGFVGVIIAVFGFVVGSNIQNISGNSLIIIVIGISILLISILISVIHLTPKKNKLPVLKIREFYEDWKEKKLDVELIEIYLDHIDEMIQFNNSKLESTRWIYNITFTGLVISFIGIICSLIT